MVNKSIVFNLLGRLLMIETMFMIVSGFVSLLYAEQDFWDFILSGGISLGFGVLLVLITSKGSKSIAKREGYLIVSLVWVFMALAGALPFYISGAIPSYTDAFFETISGFTTTGASILNDIESLSHGLLFWRSITQWLGGMGIIVLSLAILPVLGIGGMQLFVAEVPGPTPDKLHPRITETAKRLWGIYIIFTVSEMILLVLGGMNFFDSVCHSFTTMATGGYSTHQESIAYYQSPYIQYVITLFMFLAGTNFTLSYFGLHLKFKKVWKNEEFRTYLTFVLAMSVIITLGLMLTQSGPLELRFRESLFQVVSIITTTGFVTADYAQWAPFLMMLLFMGFFLGGSAGSTGGSIKIVRVWLTIKNAYKELLRLVHPNAVIAVKLNNKAVHPKIVANIVSFVVLYMMIFILGVMVMAMMGLDFESSMGSVAATLGNIGPGIGSVGPVENFAHIPAAGKWFLSLLMVIGRLELFTVIILFSPAFWKR